VSATCPTHLILLDAVNLIIYGENLKILSFSICISLQPPVTSFHLCPKILLSSWISNSLYVQILYLLTLCIIMFLFKTVLYSTVSVFGWDQLDLIDWASRYLRLQSQSQSHVTTDGQSVSMSWCQIHSGTCDQILFSVCLWGALSDEKSSLSLVSYC
jgi:hypothetical protein